MQKLIQLFSQDNKRAISHELEGDKNAFKFFDCTILYNDRVTLKKKRLESAILPTLLRIYFVDIERVLSK